MKTIKNAALIDFTSNLALLLNAGLSVPDSITMIQSYAGNREIRELTNFLADGLQKGKSFSDMITGEDSPFPMIYQGLVSIGDRIGSLSKILPTLSSYLQRQKKIRDRTVNASIYPLMVLSITFLGMIFLALFILPRLETLFSGLIQSQDELADINRNIRAFTSFISLSSLLILFCAALFPLSRRFKKIRIMTESILLKLPGIRRIILDTNIYNFTFAVETLTSHGIPLSKAIYHGINVCTSTIIGRAFSTIHIDITSGRGLHSSFARQKVLPPRLIQWVGIGENTGNTDKVFRQLRIFYESEIENLTSRFLGIVEPGLIILVGILIISLILTFVVPLISLFGTII